MLFNSLDFAIFLPIVLTLYWLLRKNLKYQNGLIALASYVFYACWNWKFLSLIFFSTVVDFIVAQLIYRQPDKKKKKLMLTVSILVNLGFLGFFKYFNFFLDSFTTAFSFFGQSISASSLQIVLPVGISFYTFQTLSYTIDVYKQKLKPTNDLVAFSAFVCFFPQLVAGPIERATNLLPQFQVKRQFNYAAASDGLRQILWGLFKKMVIADNCAHFANMAFNNSDHYSGLVLLLGALFFSLQIYGDFSGYSDIAIGVSRLFGFRLMRNFAFPYFSRDIAEFWRRWHISLSTWFRDYLYIPLGGSKGSVKARIRNTFIIFIVSGFWHGANWTFVGWGALHAIFFLPLLLKEKNRKHIDIVAHKSTLPSAKEILQIIHTFSLVAIAWIFFRAESLNHAYSYIIRLFSGLIHKSSYIEAINFAYWEIGYSIPLLIIFFFAIEWVGRRWEHPLEYLFQNWPIALRYFAYYALVFTTIYFAGSKQQFIYFQF